MRESISIEKIFENKKVIEYKEKISKNIKAHLNGAMYRKADRAKKVVIEENDRRMDKRIDIMENGVLTRNFSKDKFQDMDSQMFQAIHILYYNLFETKARQLRQCTLDNLVLQQTQKMLELDLQTGDVMNLLDQNNKGYFTLGDLENLQILIMGHPTTDFIKNTFKKFKANSDSLYTLNDVKVEFYELKIMIHKYFMNLIQFIEEQQIRNMREIPPAL